jgi:uncharacterized protein (TIGR00725 family)
MQQMPCSCRGGSRTAPTGFVVFLYEPIINHQGGPHGETVTQPVYIAVIGGSEISPETAVLAREVGREVAARGAVLLNGGLGGVMAAAAQGAREAGGVSLGILPDGNRRRANPYLTYTIATNLGHARNVLIAHSADALIAVDGSYGTISEAAIALKLGKPVIALNVAWDLPGLKPAATAAEAVALAWEAVKR